MNEPTMSMCIETVSRQFNLKHVVILQVFTLSGTFFKGQPQKWMEILTAPDTALGVWIDSSFPTPLHGQ